jgi:3-phosphoshikimate 1-carboxyvinyltransferase
MYLLASLARGESTLRQPLASEDTDGLLAALKTLGTIVRSEHDVVRIDGGNGRFPKGGSVNLGAGGTPTRFMIAAATLARLAVEIDGNERMRERPIAEGVELVRAIGGTVEYLKGEGSLPVRTLPSHPLRGGSVDVSQTASSQFISAIMLIAPWTTEGVSMTFTQPPTSETYLELTVRCLRRVGVRVEVERHPDTPQMRSIRIEPTVVEGVDLAIEADASAAIYPAALAAMSAGARVELLGLAAGSAQPDMAAIKALGAIGAHVEILDDRVVVTSPETLQPFDLDCSPFPDAALMLAVVASRCEGRSHLRGLETLRVKETDRVAALATELKRFGCAVDVDHASLAIEPGRDPGGEVHVSTYDDHRMAMAFAILGAVRGGVWIENPDCAAKSHPGFWAELDRLTGHRSPGDTA